MKNQQPPDQRAIFRVLQEPLLEAMRSAIAELVTECAECVYFQQSEDAAERCEDCDERCMKKAKKILQQAIEEATK